MKEPVIGRGMLYLVAAFGLTLLAMVLLILGVSLLVALVSP